MENELLPFSTPRGRPPPTVVDVVSVRSRSSSSSSSSSSPPTVTFNKTLGVQANEEKEKEEEEEEEEEEVEAEIDDQERRLGSHITTRRSRLPPVAPPQATKKKAKCDVNRDPSYDHDDNSNSNSSSSASNSNSNSDNDNDFLESPTLRSHPPHRSRHRNRTTTTASAGSDGLFPPTCDPLYHLYDLSSSSYYLPEHAMFSLIHNPRTFLRFIFGIVFLMCFLTNMVSGGPLAAQHLRDAFRGHRPWKSDNERRDDDITQSQSSPPPQGSSNIIRVAASPIQIDPHGVYIRASPLYSSSSDGRHPDTSRIIAGFASTSGSDRVLRVSSSTNSGASWSPLGEITRFPSDGTHDLDNAMPLALPSGRILFAFRHHSLSPSSSSTGFHYTFYRLDICSSSDGGRTWSFLSHIDQRAASNEKNGLWEPFLRLAADGKTIQAYYSSENSAGDQDNLMRYSTDEGKTWSDPPILVSSSPTADSRDGMTGVSAISSSSPRELICVFETTSPDGTFSIARVLSHDDGLTWGERENVYMAQGGKWAGAPQVYLVGDTLVTSFLTNEGTDLPKIDGAYTKVVVSKDQGKTWTETGKAETVAGTGSHWPGLYSLNGTHFLALYSTDEMGAVSQLHSVS